MLIFFLYTVPVKLYRVVFSLIPSGISYSYSSLYSILKQQWNKNVPGGGKESRTPDPLLARQVLSQLSYTPTYMKYPKP